MCVARCPSVDIHRSVIEQHSRRSQLSTAPPNDIASALALHSRRDCHVHRREQRKCTQIARKACCDELQNILNFRISRVRGGSDCTSARTPAAQRGSSVQSDSAASAQRFTRPPSSSRGTPVLPANPPTRRTTSLIIGASCYGSLLLCHYFLLKAGREGRRVVSRSMQTV